MGGGVTRARRGGALLVPWHLCRSRGRAPVQRRRLQCASQYDEQTLGFDRRVSHHPLVHGDRRHFGRRVDALRAYALGRPRRLHRDHCSTRHLHDIDDHRYPGIVSCRCRDLPASPGEPYAPSPRDLDLPIPERARDVQSQLERTIGSEYSRSAVPRVRRGHARHLRVRELVKFRRGASRGSVPENAPEHVGHGERLQPRDCASGTRHRPPSPKSTTTARIYSRTWAALPAGTGSPISSPSTPL